MTKDTTRRYEVRVWTRFDFTDREANCTHTTVQARGITHAREVLAAEHGQNVMLSIWAEEAGDDG